MDSTNPPTLPTQPPAAQPPPMTLAEELTLIATRLRRYSADHRVSGPLVHLLLDMAADLIIRATHRL